MPQRGRWSALLLGLLLLTSCGSMEWAAPIEKLGEQAWPPPPGPGKVIYLGELKQFRPIDTSVATLVAGESIEGVLRQPVAIAVGQDGRLAIVDQQLLGVHLYVPAEKRYRLLTKAGSGLFRSPVSVAIDERLNLYVSDSALAKVFVYDAAGELVREVASLDSVSLERPTGLAYLPDRDFVAVSDTILNKVFAFAVNGQTQMSLGRRGLDQGEFNYPTHLGTDPTGRLYIADSMNFRVQVYSDELILERAFGHHGNGSGDFSMLKGLAADRWGVVYVVDALFDAVQLFDQEGKFLLTVGGRGDGPGEFWLPSGLHIDSQNRLYICDTYNQRVQIFQLLGPEPTEGN